MALPTTRWNLQYTFVAMLTAALVSVLAVVASMLLLFSERVFVDFDADLPAVFCFLRSWG